MNKYFIKEYAIEMTLIELRICLLLDCKGRIDKITEILNYLNTNGFLTNLVLMYDETIRAENIDERPDVASLTIDARDDKLRFKYYNGSEVLWFFHTQDLFEALISKRDDYEKLVDKYRPVTAILLDMQSDFKTSIKRISYRYYPDMDNEIAYDLLFSSEIKEQGLEAKLLTEINDRLWGLDDKDLQFTINFDFDDKKCTVCEEARNERIAKHNKEI